MFEKELVYNYVYIYLFLKEFEEQFKFVAVLAPAVFGPDVIAVLL